MNNDVVFRRIRGHIVPIKRKPLSDKAQGIGLAGLGAATVLGAGTLSGSLGQAGKRAAYGSSLFAKKASKVIAKGGSANKILSKSVKHFKAAQRLISAGKGLHYGGAVIGGGLLAGGLLKLMPKDKRDNPAALGVAGVAGSAAALGTINYLVKKRAFPFLK